MKKFAVHITLAAVCAAAFSCMMDDMQVTGADPVSLEIRAASLAPDVKVRIIIADAATGRVLSNEYPVDMSSAYTKKVKPGRLNIHVIGNEPARLTWTLGMADHEDGLLPLTILTDELPETEDPPGSEESSNIPIYKKVTADVRIKSSDPEKAEVSTDGGGSWSDALNLELERLGVRIGVGIRKYTDPATVVVEPLMVTIYHLPQYSYLAAAEYNGAEYPSAMIPYSPSQIVPITGNADLSREDNYLTLFDNCIIPEYILPDPADAGKAVILYIHIRYDGRNLTFQVPLRTRPDTESYSLYRNDYHQVNLTVFNQEQVVATPVISYTVTGWDDGNNTMEWSKTVQFSASWAAGTLLTGNTAYVPTGDAAEFKFKLARPAGSTWTATLTNPVDFMFDYTGGAVSSGLAGDNAERTVRIRPRKGTTSGNVRTEFYITVHAASENIELDLPNEVTGTGNRYTIEQIPD